MTFKLMSPAFSHGERIPSLYTCDGKDNCPPLKWYDAPGGTESFALIMDDPDAPRGTWDHWIVFNIPAQNTAWLEGDTTLPQGAKWGKNTWGRLDYGGPCPPDREHRYVFKLYALDTTLELPEGATKQALEKAMAPYILEKAELMGRYERPSR